MPVLPSTIRVTEVGPRDGLQNQAEVISTRTKIALVNALSESGVQHIEVSAFVHPEWVPQLADADEVFDGITRVSGVTYSALVPNEQGWSRAEKANVGEVAVITAASETFSKKNTNTSIQGSIERLEPIVQHATSKGIRVKGYISCTIACPYEERTDLQVVRNIAEQLLDLGVSTISLGETMGIAIPTDIRKLYDALDGVLTPEASILHLHNTHGRALECVNEAMQCGVFQFDSSCGGLGGCPYAPGAAGNLATEDLVMFASQLGIETGIDFESLVAASQFIESELACKLPSAAYRKSQDA